MILILYDTNIDGFFAMILMPYDTDLLLLKQEKHSNEPIDVCIMKHEYHGNKDRYLYRAAWVSSLSINICIMQQKYHSNHWYVIQHKCHSINPNDICIILRDCWYSCRMIIGLYLCSMIQNTHSFIFENRVMQRVISVSYSMCTMHAAWVS